jgi:hypothetical protein
VTALSLTIVNPVELLCRLFKCTQQQHGAVSGAMDRDTVLAGMHTIWLLMRW